VLKERYRELVTAQDALQLAATNLKTIVTRGEFQHYAAWESPINFDQKQCSVKELNAVAAAAKIIRREIAKEIADEMLCDK